MGIGQDKRDFLRGSLGKTPRSPLPKSFRNSLKWEEQAHAKLG